MTKRYRVLLPPYIGEGTPEAETYRLSYPTDAKMIKRLLAGADVPMEARGMKEVAAGEVVEDVPSVSVGSLLEQGYIEEVADEG